MSDGVLFWVTDVNAQPLAPGDYTGSATVKGPNGVVQVPLMVMEDHLHAATPLVQGQPATIGQQDGGK